MTYKLKINKAAVDAEQKEDGFLVVSLTSRSTARVESLWSILGKDIVVKDQAGLVLHPAEGSAFYVATTYVGAHRLLLEASPTDFH